MILSRVVLILHGSGNCMRIHFVSYVFIFLKG
jgi:hypothetical protein